VVFWVDPLCADVKGVAKIKGTIMNVMTRHNFTVGMNLGGRSRTVNVEAEDALIAALKVKHENTDAIINYVRKCNKRGDQRHPHKTLTNE
jgi:hypothetical protein